jgi:hypothetical protein
MLFTKSASGARKQITLAWSSASMTAQQAALDIVPLGSVLGWMPLGILD